MRTWFTSNFFSYRLSKFFLASVGCGIVTLATISARKKQDHEEVDQYLSFEGETLSRIKEELPSVSDAQKMTVCRIPNAVSDAEIQEILDFERDHRGKFGISQRDSKGFKRIDWTWQTSYLHTNHLFQSHKPHLIEKFIQLALQADQQEQWGILNNSRDQLNIRVIELHTVTRSGGLVDPNHCDLGSLVTVDVMCSDSSQFEGGDFQTLEANGTLLTHPFHKGDAVIFPSHKFHCVQPVRSGQRQVFVMELWRGEERSCAHRCLQHLGECNYSLQQNRMEKFLTAAQPDIDPW